MKKLYFIIGLLAVNLSFSQIQSQDFEAATIPDGWTTTIISGGVDWTFGTLAMPGGADFTSNAAIFDDDAAGDTELDNTAQLLSPAIDISTATGVTLGFEYSLQDYIGSGYLTAEVWNGTGWIEILNISVDTPPTIFSLDVSAYVNPAFQVRFTYDDDDDFAWGAGVDNFSITGTMANSSFTQSKISVSPNPTADFININTVADLTNIAIVDINGRLVKKIENGTSRVDITNLSAGTYFLTYETEGNHYVNRIVRK